MREIKFRVWRFKEFIHVDQFEMLENLFSWRELVVDEKLRNWQFYTGLKDKNGKDIYEGDIVDTGFEYNAEVRFEDGAFVIESRTSNSWWDYATVIGNIYENPELIK